VHAFFARRSFLVSWQFIECMDSAK
jgi:hypothetical protein